MSADSVGSIDLYTRALSSPADHRLWGYLFEYARVDGDRGLVGEVQAHANRQARALERGEWLDLYWKCCLYAATYDFDCYLQYIERGRRPGTRFYLPRRHYLLPMVKAYQKIFDGELDLLTISQPKRTGKSQTGINFVNMISGRNPNGSVLMEGAGDTLVRSFFNGPLEILQNPQEYGHYDVFPARLVGTNADVKTINLDKKSRFPTVMCRSIDATQVGLSEATNLL